MKIPLLVEVFTGESLPQQKESLVCRGRNDTEENAMKKVVSSTALLIRSGLRTLEAEVAEMRQKNLIRILNAKQKRESS